MSEPYTIPLITKLLRKMTASQLGRAHPYDFQRWPAKKIVKGVIISELITNERASRRRAG